MRQHRKAAASMVGAESRVGWGHLGWSSLAEGSPEVSDPLNLTSLVQKGDQCTLICLAHLCPRVWKGGRETLPVWSLLLIAAAVLKRSTPPPSLQDRLLFDVQATGGLPDRLVSATDSLNMAYSTALGPVRT